MRFWDVSGPDVEAADAEPWGMTLAIVMRPFTTRSLVRLTLAAALLLGMSGLGGLALALAAQSDARHPSLFIGFNIFAVSLALSLPVFLLVIPPRIVRRVVPVLGMGMFVGTPLMVSWGLWAGGPGLGVVLVAFVETPLFAFYGLRRRWAIAAAALVVGCLGLVLLFQDGWPAPTATWLFVTANIVGTGVLIGQVAARSDELAASEHDARVELAALNETLADLNHTLADRVDAQVAEIEQLGGLRRFLSPQIADVVLSGNSAEMTKPHRRRIAVFFCDLRGFTAFTTSAEPEEVIEVLDQYYGAIGSLLQSYDATVGDYAGDGIMAYFGDPVPRQDSALAAVEMTGEVAQAMAGVVAEWKHHGYDLDFGIGVAYGYATLGVVGFDGRYDYKPVGGVVNLAARLCSKAGAGQVLIDHATYAATSERFTSIQIADLDLKGYPGGTRAYALQP